MLRNLQLRSTLKPKLFLDTAPFPIHIEILTHHFQNQINPSHPHSLGYGRQNPRDRRHVEPRQTDRRQRLQPGPLEQPQPPRVVQIPAERRGRAARRYRGVPPDDLRAVREDDGPEVDRHPLVPDEDLLQGLVQNDAAGQEFPLLGSAARQRQLGQPLEQLGQDVVASLALGAAGEGDVQDDAEGLAADADEGEGDGRLVGLPVDELHVRVVLDEDEARPGLEHAVEHGRGLPVLDALEAAALVGLVEVLRERPVVQENEGDALGVEPAGPELGLQRDDRLPDLAELRAGCVAGEKTTRGSGLWLRV